MEMHRAVRKWADIQREGQIEPTRKKWEQMHNLNEQETKKEKRAKAKAEKAKLEAEASGDASAASSTDMGSLSELVALSGRTCLHLLDEREGQRTSIAVQ